MVVLYFGCYLVIFSFLLFLTLSSFYSWGNVRNLSIVLTFRKSYNSGFVTLFLECLVLQTTFVQWLGCVKVVSRLNYISLLFF